MKKLFLFFVMTGCFAASQAQVKFGAKAGLNIADFAGKDAEGTKAKVGFHIGALVQLPLIDKLSLQPELVFSTQGAKENDEDGDLKMNVSYINVPVLAKYTFIEGLSAQSGPQFGFLISAKAKAEGEKVDMKDYFKKLDLSWVFGASYVTPMNIGFDLRYNLGLTKVGKGDIAGDAKVHNSVLQLGVFYLFGGK
ncbi:MAG: porin family protein [Chitinophagaceae bacterium]